MSSSGGLTDIISSQFESLLQNPQDFPQEFLDWLPQYLSVNAPAISNADIQGGTFTPVDGDKHSIDWGTGELVFSKSATASDNQQHGLGQPPAFLVAFPGAAGVMIGGTGDGGSVTIQGLLPAAATLTVPYFWLALA